MVKPNRETRPMDANDRRGMSRALLTGGGYRSTLANGADPKGHLRESHIDPGLLRSSLPGSAMPEGA